MELRDYKGLVETVRRKESTDELTLTREYGWGGQGMRLIDSFTGM